MVSILKKLDSGLCVKDQNGESPEEMPLHDIIEVVRNSILDSHPELMSHARWKRSKRREISCLVTELTVSQNLIARGLSRSELADKVVQELCGLGPIDNLLNDEEVTEIMVNGSSEVFVERNGEIHRTSVAFKDDDHVIEIANRIVSSVGRRVDRSMPFVDARLPDGSRINVIIPPLALNGPVLTIRRFPVRYVSLADLVRLGTILPEGASFLKACVDARLDIIISGGCGSGKTTTMNILANLISPGERIIVIEDSSELRIPEHHVIYLEPRLVNTEGRGEVTIRDLLRNALRMRPDRIVIGECRGKETLDLIFAMNTGHNGCLSTVHANSAQDCLQRILGMALMAEDGVPVNTIRSWVGIAVDVIIHQTKGVNGSRVINGISIVGEDESASLKAQTVYSHPHGLILQEVPSWFKNKSGVDLSEDSQLYRLLQGGERIC